LTPLYNINFDEACCKKSFSTFNLPIVACNFVAQIKSKEKYEGKVEKKV
jgi:hypothetical protein